MKTVHWTWAEPQAVPGKGTMESGKKNAISNFCIALPSKLVAVAKLDILRHQRFAEPLPFTDAATAYEYVKTYVDTFVLRLDCAGNGGGGGAIALNRGFSVWDGRPAGTDENPDACKEGSPGAELWPYVAPLKLVVHEARHSEPGDPGHTICDGRPKDATFENGSGYAWGAMYDMWVYKYGLYDPPAMKDHSKAAAKGALQGAFCSTPIHSDPMVQAIISELLE